MLASISGRQGESSIICLWLRLWFHPPIFFSLYFYLRPNRFSGSCSFVYKVKENGKRMRFEGWNFFQQDRMASTKNVACLFHVEKINFVPSHLRFEFFLPMVRAWIAFFFADRFLRNYPLYGKNNRSNI